MSKRKKRGSAHDFESEKPWTEAQWEAFMKEGDLRAARYCELFETLHDDPERDDKVAREMGWLDDEDEEMDPEEAAERERWIDEMNQAAAEAQAEMDAERAAGIDPAEQMEAEIEAEKRENPAYAAAMALGHKVIDLSKRHLKPERPDPREQEDEDDLIRAAFIGILTAGTKLAKGHGMGYEDRSICANIVCCRWALEAAQSGRAGWEGLRSRDVFPVAAVDEIVREHIEVERLITERIAELRSHVWW